jgi:haloalkane dehalogenase
VTAPDWIDRAEYPFESHFFQTAAGRLHYVDEGSGTPVVMVHGNPTWSFLYRRLVKRLRDDHRCIAMDHLGFGLSDKPSGWSYLPRDHAANLAGFIEHLGLKDVTLVVQDWGGPIGLSYAVARPENVARLVILNTWAWPVNHDPYYVAFSGFVGGPIGRALIRRRNFFVKSLMPRLFGDRATLSAATHEHYLRALGSPADRTGCLVLPKQIIGSTPWLAELWRGLPVLDRKPALIVWGMKDIGFREKELRRWQGVLPIATTVRLESVGHFVQEEAPAELGKAVAAFLKPSTRVDV